VTEKRIINPDGTPNRNTIRRWAEQRGLTYESAFNLLMEYDEDDPFVWMPDAKGAMSGKTGEKMINLSRMLAMEHFTSVDNSHISQLTQQFVAATDFDIAREVVQLALNASRYTLGDVTDAIKAKLSNSRAVQPFSDDTTIVNGDCNGVPVLVIASGADHQRRRLGRSKISGGISISVTVVSRPDIVDSLSASLKEELEQAKLAEIVWWTQTSHGAESREFFLPENQQKLHPEFYPMLSNPDKYIEDYIASDAAVLLVLGPPGTGKTTLLRQMISKHKLCAHVIYDENLMKTDVVFQQFLFGDNGDLMIIEDADTILSKREDDGNKLMSRFLNVSDGLIKLPSKKLVFTTNLTDISKIDPALMRPGRCFGVLQTRLLNLSEAQAAAKAANLPIPIEKKEYSVAQLFNQSNGVHLPSFGFGVNHG
jgi:hypothetical protein